MSGGTVFLIWIVLALSMWAWLKVVDVRFRPHVACLMSSAVESMR